MEFESIIFVMCIGLMWAQIQPSPYGDFRNLPPEMQSRVTALSEQSKVQAEFQKRCEKNGGPDAFKKFSNAFMTYNNRCRTVQDPNKLRQIENAKPSDQFLEALKYFCQNRSQLKTCNKDLAEGIKPCYSVAEQKNLDILEDASEKVTEFVCLNNAEKVASFISENGPECVQGKLVQIQQCFNNSLGTETEIKGMEIFNIPEINFEKKECKLLDKFEVCVVNTLKTCPSPYPANFVDSLYKTARSATPCNSASGPLPKLITIIILVLLALVSLI